MCVLIGVCEKLYGHNLSKYPRIFPHVIDHKNRGPSKGNGQEMARENDRKTDEKKRDLSADPKGQSHPNRPVFSKNILGLLHELCSV